MAVCARPREQGQSWAVAGRGGQGPPVSTGRPLPSPARGGLAHHQALGFDPRQLLPWECSSLHTCHLDGRAWKSPSGTSPTLVLLGSGSPGIHIGVDASSLLVFSRTTEPKWTGNGFLSVCPFLPLILD